MRQPRRTGTVGGLFDQAFIQSLTKNKGDAKDAFQKNQKIFLNGTGSKGLGIHVKIPPAPVDEVVQHPQFCGSAVSFTDPNGQVKDAVVKQVKPPPGKTTARSIEVFAAVDPNDKEATGFGPGGFLAAGTPITYTVEFENSAGAGATAPAQEVLVTDQLSSSLDWSTLQLAAICFSNTYVDVPAGHDSLSTVATIPGNPDPVYVTASLDRATGVVTWDIMSIDPATGGLPADPFAGFLPVEDGTGNGIGFVSFTVLPKAGLSDGSQFTNTATITFDPAYGANPPIVTNQTVNTIDTTPPRSSISALPAETSPAFTVNWAGTDGTDSGIASYDVYVSTDGGPYALWQSQTTATSAAYSGQVGSSYGFYSIATDNVGNVEATPAGAEATTTVRDPLNPLRQWVSGGMTVSVYDVSGSVDVNPSDIVVKFGKGNSVSSITLGGTQSMDGLGIVISGATSVGSSRTGGRGRSATWRSSPPMRRSRASSSSGGMSGYNLNGLTLGGMAFAADIDGDGDTSDATAIYSEGAIGKVSFGRSITGDVWIDGALAPSRARRVATTATSPRWAAAARSAWAGTLPRAWTSMAPSRASRSRAATSRAS